MAVSQNFSDLPMAAGIKITAGPVIVLRDFLTGVIYQVNITGVID
jgi:hypothetical protein